MMETERFHDESFGDTLTYIDIKTYDDEVFGFGDVSMFYKDYSKNI